MATSAAAFTVPSPPQTPRTRARAAAFSNSVSTSAGSLSTISAPGSASCRACIRSAVPEALFATTTRPVPSGSAGAFACGRPGGGAG